MGGARVADVCEVRDGGHNQVTKMVHGLRMANDIRPLWVCLLGALAVIGRRRWRRIRIRHGEDSAGSDDMVLLHEAVRRYWKNIK